MAAASGLRRWTMNHAQGQREELKRFLKTRRERIAPSDAGLAVVGRRRTRGLTREDVAHLAGVSFKWYTLFESGAAPGVSRGFLDRVSAVLRLSRVERLHLFGLLGFADTKHDEARPSGLENLGRLVGEFDVAPAAIYSSAFDVLHHNLAYDALFRHSDRPGGLQANKVWRFFLDPQMKSLWRDWEAVAQHVVGQLHFFNAPNLSSPAFQALLAHLQQSPEFCRMWAQADVSDLTSPKTAHFELSVPEFGVMAFDVASLVSQCDPVFVFAALLPADAQCRKAMRALVDRHAASMRRPSRTGYSPEMRNSRTLSPSRTNTKRDGPL